MSMANTSQTGDGSLAELFHLVKSLIPEGQEVGTVPPDMTVAEAIRIMDRYKYSQLPVVAGQAVLGVFSFRSLALRLLGMERLPQNLDSLPVDEFVQHFQFVQPSDNWESILKHLDREDAVLIGHRDRLDGIVTAMDVLVYLHAIASPFVMLAEIELALRRIIEECTSQDELQSCIQTSLEQWYGEKLPASLSDMTFSDYVQIIGDSRNWPHFATVFGPGEWQRKTTTARLKEVGDLRNDVFHFRREMTPQDLDLLTTRRDWLQMKARAFEATKADEAADAKEAAATRPPEQSAWKKWDEQSFFQELEQRCGARDAATAKKILEWAQAEGLSIWWGEGQRSGSFFLGLRRRGEWHHLIGVWTGGSVELQFEYMAYRSPFKTEAKRLELFQRLDASPSVDLPDDAITRRPGIPLSDLADEAVLEQFLSAFTWAAEEIKET